MQPSQTSPLDVVPADVLARPERDVVRHIDKEAAAIVVDEHLRRLAAHEAACRRVLGTVAAAFLDANAHHEIGLARLSDYAQERLGMSARELQSAAQVARALRRLPAIAAAFARGDVSWTQARLLSGTANETTEATWLARARGRTIRALEAMIRSADALEVEATAMAFAPLDAALGECAEESVIDGEAVVAVRVSCPRRVRAMWRDTVELARQVMGKNGPVWEAAEAIAAEASTDGPLARDGNASAPADELRAHVGAADARSCPDEAREMFDSRSEVGRLDWRAIQALLPDDVEMLARDLDGLSPAALDERLRAATRALQRLDWQAGRLLRLCFDLRLHRVLGFSSGARYVRERLGMSTGRAAALAAVERRLWDVPALGDAYRNGAVSWVQVLTLLPVISERHAAAWLARADAVTVRRLGDEARWALDEQDERRPFAWIAPPPLGASLERPALQMRARWVPERSEVAVTFRAPASVAKLFRVAMEAFRPPGEPSWVGLVGMLDHVQGEWRAQHRPRDPVFARDGWRCTVPACSSRRHLHDHHIRFRSRGGGNDPANRTTVCAWHHLRGLHHGRRVVAWGWAPHAIRWTLGVREDGGPFLRFLGDCYVGREEPARASAA
jgi:hypothetical protein